MFFSIILLALHPRSNSSSSAVPAATADLQLCQQQQQ
jgi:hypothetical protein